MNIIIIGCGKIGAALADQLNNEGHRVTVVDKNEKVLQAVAAKYDVMGVTGNGAMVEVLREAGIADADLLISVTGSDELNMLCCLIAKKEGHCSTVARIRNPEYDREIEYFKREMNISMVVNPEKIAAHEIVRLILFPSAREIDTFAQGRVDMVKVRLSSKSILCGTMLKDLSKKTSVRALIVCIEREKEIIIPTGMTELKPGDLISFLAEPNTAMAFMKECVFNYKPIRTAFLIGGGKIAYYIASYMKNRRNRVTLKVFEKDLSRANYMASEFPRITVVNADGSSQQLLEEEGIESADAVISLTGMDEENIVMSLFVNRLSPNATVITKVNHIDPEDVDKLQLGPVVCPKAATSYQVMRYARGLQSSMNSGIETLYKIAGGRAEAVEFIVNEEKRLVDIPLISLQLKPNVLVGAIIRDGQVIYPGGSDYLHAGDRVVIITASKAIRELHDILA